MTTLSALDTFTSQNSVAVIIAAYNASRTISRAVASALQQSEVTEVIVVDDASTDGTSESALAADDRTGRLKILKQTVNSGPSASRNRAIQESSSTWISILDADDFFLAGRMNNLLSLSDSADLIADDMWQVAETSIECPRISLLGEELKEPKKISFSDFVSSNVSNKLRQRAELGFIKPLMRRTFLSQNGIKYQENMRLGEDYELYAHALAMGARLIISPFRGYVSVVRPNSLSGQHTENDLFQLRECDIKLKNLKGLSDEDREALHKHFLSIDCRLQWRLLILAVKQRNVRAAIGTFLRPYPVPIYLVARLIEQFVLRSKQKIQRIS